jgi:hypothetical protein
MMSVTRTVAKAAVTQRSAVFRSPPTKASWTTPISSR